MKVDELEEKLHNENLVVVDVRFDLQDPDAGRKLYIESHLPNAVYLDLNKDLSGKVKKHGGNHPLPDVDIFSAKLGNIGIDNETTVVIYDAENGMFSARMWWLLYYFGHEKMYLLEGGYNGWLENGKEVTTTIPISRKKNYIPKIRHNEVVDIHGVKEKLSKNESVLIDSRAKERYLGKVEPLYPKAGHIPGAKNYFWKDVLDENGYWKTSKELEKHFQLLNKEEEIIVSCGSGVSACPNIIALKQAGYKNVKLYPGSFSDWISYDENRVEKKEE
nr:sulfurtransferase [Ornithinibacillus halophilus]